MGQGHVKYLTERTMKSKMKIFLNYNRTNNKKNFLFFAIKK